MSRVANQESGGESPHFKSEHVPVLLREIMAWMKLSPGAVVVDGTLGGGGHTQALAGAVGPEGRVLAIDLDPAARQRAQQRLKGMPVTLVDANFCELPEVLQQLAIAAVDGVLLDLGLSSDQLADDTRGFSFDSPGPLDLRFNPNQGRPAWEWIARIDERRLADVIREFGEERHARRIARAIVQERSKGALRNARDVAQLVRGCVRTTRARGAIDPATRTFQAMRIAVNDELRSLEMALDRIPHCLKPGGRLAVISFHSLEDRRVKRAFLGDPRLVALTRKPVRSTEAETAGNPRARSAKLRVAARRQNG
jgi:16S rRNA (cytosine1402-N4)-methyltransferase